METMIEDSRCITSTHDIHKKEEASKQTTPAIQEELTLTLPSSHLVILIIIVILIAIVILASLSPPLLGFLQPGREWRHRSFESLESVGTNEKPSHANNNQCDSCRAHPPPPTRSRRAASACQEQIFWSSTMWTPQTGGDDVTLTLHHLCGSKSSQGHLGFPLCHFQRWMWR